MCGREGYSFGSWRSRTSAIWKKPYSTKRLSYKTYRSYRTYKSYRTTFNFSASLIGLQRRLPVYHILFAAPPPAGDFDPNVGWLIVAAVAVVVLLIFLFIFFSLVQLWIQSLLAGAGEQALNPQLHEAEEDKQEDQQDDDGDGGHDKPADVRVEVACRRRRREEDMVHRKPPLQADQARRKVKGRPIGLISPIGPIGLIGQALS